jgi:hypothetical protein
VKGKGANLEEGRRMDFLCVFVWCESFSRVPNVRPKKRKKSSYITSRSFFWLQRERENEQKEEENKGESVNKMKEESGRGHLLLCLDRRRRKEALACLALVGGENQTKKFMMHTMHACMHATRASTAAAAAAATAFPTPVEGKEGGREGGHRNRRTGRRETPNEGGGMTNK